MRERQELRVVGKSVTRLDAVGKVTGAAIYGTDVQLPGMVYGKIVRSAEPHARVVRIDTTRAARLQGVRAVITAADCPSIRFGGSVKDQPILAVDRVRHLGEPLAAVAATSLEIAEEAARLVEVTLEPLAVLDDPEAAMAPGAPLLHEAWKDYVAFPEVRRSGNVCNHVTIACGDVEAGFGEADAVIEGGYQTRMVHQGYTEPRAAVAAVDASGHVTLWSNTQLPFEVRGTVAEILGLPVSRVRVIVTAVGGGFGGKLRAGVEPFCALLARKAGRPVRIVTTTEEELTAAFARQACRIHVKTGVRRDGTIAARQVRIVFDTGAYAGSGPAVASLGSLVAAGPYRIPNLRVDSYCVYTNKTNCGSFRAPSGPQVNFAIESANDEAARAIAMDPVEFRRRNLVREGDRTATGQVLRGVGMGECLERAAAAIGWGAACGPNRGRGIACAWGSTNMGGSSASVKLNEDGSVTLATGATEIGTGALAAGAVQILAEAMGVEPAEVILVSGDTDATPYDAGAQGSRTASLVGNAVRLAAADARRQLLDLAASALGLPAERLELRYKAIRERGGTDRGLTLAQLGQLSLKRGGPIIGRGSYAGTSAAHDPTTVQGSLRPVFDWPTFSAHAAEIAVDPETGEVTVLRYVVAQDVGFAINPQYLKGQIEGGVVQGLGQALSEEIVMEAGRVLNPNLTDYKMPTALDVPPIESILVEAPSQHGPYGAKGAAEPPAVCPPATVANAIAAATGARLRSLPITAEKVLWVLGGLGAQSATGSGT